MNEINYREDFHEFFTDDLKYLSSLTDRERVYIGLRYCLDAVYEGKRQYIDMVSLLGVSNERISQITCKAIRKLRHPKRADEVSKITNSILYHEVIKPLIK